jgi:carboxylate-amine ligase
VPTLGVEEEFFLVRRDGTPAATSPEVLAAVADDAHVHHEWLPCQVEVASSPSLHLADIARELAEQRGTVSRAALATGSLLLACGTPPRPVPADMPVFDDPRYHGMIERFGAVSARAVTCACHVHIGVADRDLGVQVLNRIRGWLPVLLALSSNSPWWNGEDTDWHSYRYVVQGQWPTRTLPPVAADAAEYDALLGEAVVGGDAVDDRNVYWLARLSSSYPTVEIRVADTGLTVADTMLTAALCRALVATALEDDTWPHPTDGALAEDALQTSLDSAARHGLRGLVVDPVSGAPTVGGLVLHRLVQALGPALARAGDRAAVDTLLRHRMRQRSGASRQRAMRRRLAADDFVAAVADATLPRQSRGLAASAGGLPGQRTPASPGAREDPRVQGPGTVRFW